MGGQIHAPAALLPGIKQPGALWIEGWMGPGADMGGFGEDEICNLTEIQASLYTDYAIRAS